MPRPNPTSARPLSADALWVRELVLIQTSYGRLVYLAGLLDPDTGRYEHYGCTSDKSRDEANITLKHYHEAIFREWVSYPLGSKMADVQAYIAGIDEVNEIELIDAWLRLTPYKNLVPASIQGPERQKHLSDFEAILGLLRNVYGVAPPNRDA